MTRLVLAFAIIGCAEPVALAPTPELARATDTNPDPSIVEVQLVAIDGQVTYRDGAPTPVLAYRDGASDAAPSVPGPLIEATVGDRLIVHFTNQLAEATTIHWHGLRLPIEMDGDPTVNGAIEPGGTFDYDITLQDAGLFWYHPHVETDEQIELGLQGPLLVHAGSEPAVDADRTFVLDDVDLADDNTIRIEPSGDDLMFGRHGDTLLVNGAAPGAITAAPSSIERWRFVNTANGRFFKLGGTAMRVIGWDGGLVSEPYDVTELVIAPGERYDVLVTLVEPITLRTLELARGEIVEAAGDLVHVELAGAALPVRELPAVAGDVPALVVDGQTTVRQLRLKEDLAGQAGAVFFVNDERWPFNIPIDVTLGTTEILELVNDNDHDHPFHVHGHFVQVLGATPLGWKDTFVVPARSTVRAALRYEATGKWMAHCQIPEHAERGMTADLNVTL